MSKFIPCKGERETYDPLVPTKLLVLMFFHRPLLKDIDRAMQQTLELQSLDTSTYNNSSTLIEVLKKQLCSTKNLTLELENPME